MFSSNFPVSDFVAVRNMDAVIKTDYVANAGDGKENSGDNFNIPRSYASIDGFNWTTVVSEPLNNPFSEDKYCSGIVFYRSEVKVGKIKDGVSKTYFAGEKPVNPTYYSGYMAGGDQGENQSAFGGFEWDTTRLTRFTDQPNSNFDAYFPRPDTLNSNAVRAFGSAHKSGFNMVMCDGAVSHVPYTIDREVHRRLGNRLDGLSASITDP